MLAHTFPTTMPRQLFYIFILFQIIIQKINRAKQTTFDNPPLGLDAIVEETSRTDVASAGQATTPGTATPGEGKMEALTLDHDPQAAAEVEFLAGLAM